MDRNFDTVQIIVIVVKSLSARRAWIEIANFCRNRFCPTSLSARRAWIEIVITAMTSQISVSLSARRAWIEMSVSSGLKLSIPVSLSARRAWIEMQGRWQSDGQFPVALRKESVDRNGNGDVVNGIASVALRKESVDRNKGPEELAQFWSSSLSARRAWIEI